MNISGLVCAISSRLWGDVYKRQIVVWDEPRQIGAAAGRFWKRLEQIEPSPAYDPDRVFFRWEELQRQASAAPALSLEELEIAWDGLPGMSGRHISTRPTMSFHGNMQVAIAEARTLVEGGNRVAFFASSNGEVERVADILNEYGVPYQLGLEQFDSPPEMCIRDRPRTAACRLRSQKTARQGTGSQDRGVTPL